MSDTTEKPWVYAPKEEDQITLQDALASVRASRVPKDVYKLKILKGTFKVSTKQQTPFFEFEVELVDNPPQIIQGQTYEVNGQKGRTSYFLTAKAFRRLADLHISAGLPVDGLALSSILSNPQPALYEGKIFRAPCWSESEAQVNENGQPMLDSKGQQIIYHNFNVGAAC